MINMTAAALLAMGIVLHPLGDNQNHPLLAAMGILSAMAFFLLIYLQYPVLFIGNARYPLARTCFPYIRWAVFGIYFADLATTVIGYLGGPPWTVSIHAYSLWAGVYLVTYSLALLTGPPRRRRKLRSHRWLGRQGQLCPVPI